MTKLLLSLSALFIVWRIAAMLLARSARNMVEEFEQRFHGRCLICSYHKYGFMHGHEDSPRPKPHDCIEQGTHFGA